MWQGRVNSEVLPRLNQYQLQTILFALFASSQLLLLVFSAQKTKKPPQGTSFAGG
jgi:hypothetical protein